MEKILEALEQNIRLTAEVKKDILFNLYLLLNKYPNIEENYLAARLRNLEILSLPKLGEHEDIKSDGNRVFVSPNALEEKDPQNMSMQILLKGLFPNSNPDLEALYNGTTEMIANSILGESSWSDEYVTCDLLQEVMNLDNMHDNFENTYFSGNFDMILPYLQTCFTPLYTEQILSMCNQNYMRKKTQDVSLFPEIEKLLIDVFYSKFPSKKSADRFEVKLLLDPRLFGEDEYKYTSLHTVAEFHDMLKRDTFEAKTPESKVI